jgi:Asp-tRNA(Asn)/Glu-tRNA(Gln) amidotransferase A subunit family amidase
MSAICDILADNCCAIVEMPCGTHLDVVPTLAAPGGLPAGIQLVAPRLAASRLLTVTTACSSMDAEPDCPRHTLCDARPGKKLR